MELEGYGPFRQAYAYTGLAEVGVYAACLLRAQKSTFR